MQELTHHDRTGAIMIACGLAMLAAVFLVQHFAVSSMSANGRLVLSAEQSAAFSSVAMPTFGITIVAIGISIRGINRLLDSWKAPNRSVKNALCRTRQSVAKALIEQKGIFWFSLVAYAAVFMFASNSLVFSSERMSERYAADVPSYHIIGCCGQPGSFPVLTIYLSEHVGLLLIPTNMILLAYLSLLVAINAALVASRFINIEISGNSRRFSKNMSFCGISIGVLAGCPTCAGSIILSLIGGGSYAAGLSASVVASYQPVLAIGSIAALMSAPFIMELGSSPRS